MWDAAEVSGGIAGVERPSRAGRLFVQERLDPLRSRNETGCMARREILVLDRGSRGAHPSYASGYSRRDNAFYKHWDLVSRDRDRFTAWMQDHVLV